MTRLLVSLSRGRRRDRCQPGSPAHFLPSDWKRPALWQRQLVPQRLQRQADWLQQSLGRPSQVAPRRMQLRLSADIKQFSRRCLYSSKSWSSQLLQGTASTVPTRKMTTKVRATSCDCIVQVWSAETGLGERWRTKSFRPQLRGSRAGLFGKRSM